MSHYRSEKLGNSMKSSKHLKPIFQGPFFLVQGHKNWNMMELDFQPTFALCLDNYEL